MKKIILFINLIIFSANVNSQQLKIDWINQTGGPEWDIVTGLTELYNKKLLITGTFYDTIRFGSKSFVSKGSRDIYIATYNPDGSVDKMVTYGGSQYDYAKIVKPNGKEGFILPILFNNDLELSGKVVKSEKTNNCLLTWFDINLMPTKSFLMSSNSSFDITSIEIASNGELFFTGWFTDSLMVDGKTYISATKSTDIFIGKATNNGTLKWVKTYEGDSNDIAKLAVAANDETFYLSGITVTGCFARKPSKDIAENMQYLFVSRLNINGEEKEGFFPIHGNHLEPIDMIVEDNTLWILANFMYSVVIKGVELISYGKNDIILLKFDTKEQTMSYFQIGGMGNEEAKGLVKSGNEYFITGTFSGKLKFGDKQVESDEFGTDLFLAKVNSEMQPEDIYTLTGESSEFPCSIIASGSGLYLAGQFRNEIVTKKERLFSLGKEDIFLARIENCNSKNPLQVNVIKIEGPDNNTWLLDAGKGYVDYKWDGISIPSSSYPVTGPGNYLVEVTDHFGCSYKQDVEVIGLKNSVINQEELFELKEFKLWPTVTKDLVYWHPSSSWDNTETNIKVYNEAGMIVQKSEILQLLPQNHKIYLGDLPEGIYLIEIGGSGFRQISKVILKK